MVKKFYILKILLIKLANNVIIQELTTDNKQPTTYNLQRTTKIFPTPKLLNLSTPQP